MARVHKVLVIGVGSIGERHLRCFQATGRAELALLEIDEPLRRRVAGRYGVPVAHASLESALADPPDAAVVATPANFHVPISTRLAEAGVHLLIEKPLGTSLEGVARLREVAAGRQVTAALGYVYRLHPALVAMREAIAAGRFGAPLEVVAVAGQHFPTYRPAYRDIYYADRARGGGAIQDALTHLVNAGEWLAGPVERLVADAAHQALAGIEVEDTVHLLTRQRSVLGSYSLNQHQAPNELSITVVCQRGTARFESHLHRWRWLAAPEDTWHDEPVRPLERDALFLAQAHMFLDAIEGRCAPACSLEEGIQTLRVNLAALASAAQGAWQTVPRG